MSGRSPRWISIAPMIGTLRVGSVVKLNLNSTPWDWLVVHQGLPSDMYDESCDGTWLLLKDIYETRAWNSTKSNILESSTIHNYLNGDFQNLFDPTIQKSIRQVKIPYRQNGGDRGTDQSGANGLQTKAFLLSEYEMGFTTSDNSYIPVDGAKLDYFENGESTFANGKRIAYLNGTASIWWSRSPTKSGDEYVWGVADTGEHYNKGNIVTVSRGIRPAIILPSDFRISADLITAA